MPTCPLIVLHDDRLPLPLPLPMMMIYVVSVSRYVSVLRGEWKPGTPISAMRTLRELQDTDDGYQVLEGGVGIDTVPRARDTNHTPAVSCNSLYSVLYHTILTRSGSGSGSRQDRDPRLLGCFGVFWCLSGSLLTPHERSHGRR